MLRISNSEPDQITKFLEKLGVPFQCESLAELRYGDYVWDLPDKSTVGIERKTIRDFIQSYYDARIHDQLAGCLNSYEHVHLLLEGVFATNGYDAGLTTYIKLWNSFKPTTLPLAGNIHGFTKQLLNVQEHVSIILSTSHETTAQVIAGLYKKYEISPLLECQPRTKKQVSEKAMTLQEHALIASIPRLSRTAAHNLMEHFGTIHNICSALSLDPKALLKIPAVGPGAVSMLEKVLL
jgi:ERCC4-type nuclease